MRWQWHILFLNYYFRLQALLIQCVTWHLFFLFFLKMCISCVYLVIQRFCVVKGIQWIIIEITKTPVPLGKKAVWPCQQSACVGSGTTINTGFHPLGSQRKRHTHWSTNFYITHKVINSFLERKSIPLRLRFVPIILMIWTGTKVKTLTTSSLAAFFLL